jgi:hypothetical protein
VAQDQKRKQAIKGQRRYNAHIDSGDRLSVILQKSLSSLRRRILTTHHVFRDRRLGDLEAKHQQLAMDPGCAPQPVFPAHLPDQITQVTIDLRPPCPISGFPTPEHFEASTMPTQNGLRLLHLDHTNKARPEPGHPYEQRAIAATQSETRWCPPQSDDKLMAEKQILNLKPAPRLEQVGYEQSERVQDCKHRSQ